MKNELIISALKYTSQGFHVFPVMTRGKVPLTTNGFHAATCDASIIETWWKQWPMANIGIRTGEESGFFVLDVDGEDGEDSLTKIENIHGALPPTVEVITGGGGRHIYYQYPAQGGIKCSAGEIGLNLDIRGDGGYVVAPPSIHASGKAYAWSVDSADTMAPAPEWLLTLIQAPPNVHENPSSRNWQELVKGVVEGQRNDSLTRISGALFRSDLDPFIALELCLGWNDGRCKPPLSHVEVIRTVDSIAGRELSRRGGQ